MRNNADHAHLHVFCLSLLFLVSSKLLPAALVWRHREEILNFPFQAVRFDFETESDFRTMEDRAVRLFHVEAWERRQNAN